jgi:hypothetical protein
MMPLPVFGLVLIPDEKAMVNGKLPKRVTNTSAIEAIPAASQVGQQVFAFKMEKISGLLN